MDNPHNRQAQPANRGPGRPSKLDTPTPRPPEPARAVDAPDAAPDAPPVGTGVVCPACGKGMTPRRDRVKDGVCYGTCSACRARLCLTYAGGRYLTVRTV